MPFVDIMPPDPTASGGEVGALIVLEQLQASGFCFYKQRGKKAFGWVFLVCFI